MEAVEQEFLSVQEVATILNTSPNSVRRRFAKRAGVIDLGEMRPVYGRPYQSLRIPRGTLRRFIEERDVTRKRRA